MTAYTLIDTHCHLTSSKLAPRLEEIVQEAKVCGVRYCIDIGCDAPTSLQALQHAQTHPEIFCALGIQPHDASTFNIETGELLKTYLNHPKVVAVGEIGLDAYYTLSPMPKQKECFEYFLQAAAQYHLPVAVHMRETFTEIVDMLCQYPQVRGVIHCFSGGVAEARTFLDLGFYLSFSGLVTFPSAASVREALKFAPKDRILLETDSPYLAPVPHRGKINTPVFLQATAEFCAKERGETVDAFAEQVFFNTLNLFSKMKDIVTQGHKHG